MNTLEKEFVPYQESLELKELGFDEPCFAMWQKNKKLWFCDKNKWITNFVNHPDKDTLELHIKTFPHNIILIDGEYKLVSCVNFTAPTFQQAFRFFRVKYKIGTWIHHYFDVDKGDYIYSWVITLPHKDDGFVYDTYEEAELACLRKLIEILKDGNK